MQIVMIGRKIIHIVKTGNDLQGCGKKLHESDLQLGILSHFWITEIMDIWN